MLKTEQMDTLRINIEEEKSHLNMEYVNSQNI